MPIFSPWMITKLIADQKGQIFGDDAKFPSDIFKSRIHLFKPQIESSKRSGVASFQVCVIFSAFSRSNFVIGDNFNYRLATIC